MSTPGGGAGDGEAGGGSLPAAAAAAVAAAPKPPALPPRTQTSQSNLPSTPTAGTPQSSAHPLPPRALPPRDPPAAAGAAAAAAAAAHAEEADDEACMPALAMYDPGKLWPHLQRLFEVYMPLRRLTLKLPTSEQPVSVEELAVKIMVHRSRTNMEKAALKYDIPEDWYKAPFASVYMVTAESQEQYKSTVKPQLRAWVDAVQTQTRARGTWLILYVGIAPQPQQAAKGGSDDMHGKVFGWICADFYHKTPGDRSALVSLYVAAEDAAAAIATAAAAAAGMAPPDLQQLQQQRDTPSPSPPNSPGVSPVASPMAQALRPGGPTSPRHRPKEWSDLSNKIGQAVMESFEMRARLYELELRRLDNRRGAVSWDFGSFFVVKEALALMYRQFGLPAEALLKYQELAALIVTLSEARALSASDRGGDGAAAAEPIPSMLSAAADARRGSRSESERLLFGLPSASGTAQACSVLDYRKMKLRQRVYPGSLFSFVLDTQLYIFARQCHLYLDMGRPDELAKCGIAFIRAFHQELLAKLYSETARVELWGLKACWDVVKACSRYYHEHIPPGGFGDLQPESPSNQASATFQLVMAAKNQAAETSARVCTLLTFAIERLFAYAQCVAATAAPRLLESPVWQLHRKGEIDSVQAWLPPRGAASGDEGAAAAAAAAAAATALGPAAQAAAAHGEEWATSFWDSDEEGEAAAPSAESPVGVLVCGAAGHRQLHLQHHQQQLQAARALAAAAGSPRGGGGGGGGGGAFRFAMSNHGRAPSEPTAATAMGGERTAGAGSGDAEAEALEEEGGGSPKLGGGSGAAGGASQRAPSSPRANAQGQPGALETCDQLERCYLQLAHSLAAHQFKARRPRFGCLTQQRRAELLLACRHWGSGIRLLMPLASLQTGEGWDLASFWVHHRLCMCYRSSLDAADIDDGGGGSRRASYISSALAMARAYRTLKTAHLDKDGNAALPVKEAAALEAVLRDIEQLPPPKPPQTAATKPAAEGSAVAAAAGSHEYDLACACSLAVVAPQDARQGSSFVVMVRVHSHLPCPLALRGLQLLLAEDVPEPPPQASSPRRRSMRPSRGGAPGSPGGTRRMSVSVERGLDGRRNASRVRSDDQPTTASLSPIMHRGGAAWDPVPPPSPGRRATHTAAETSSAAAAAAAAGGGGGGSGGVPPPLQIAVDDAQQQRAAAGPAVFASSLGFDGAPIILEPGDSELHFDIAFADVKPGLLRVSTLTATWGEERLLHRFAADAARAFRVAEFQPTAALSLFGPPFVPPGHAAPLQVLVESKQEALVAPVVVLRSSSPDLTFAQGTRAAVIVNGESAPRSAAIACSGDGAQASVQLPDIAAGQHMEVAVELAARAGVAATDVTVTAEMQAQHVQQQHVQQPQQQQRSAVPVARTTLATSKVHVSAPFEVAFRAGGYPPGMVIVEGTLVCVSLVPIAVETCDALLGTALSLEMHSLGVAARATFLPCQVVRVLLGIAHDPSNATPGDSCLRLTYRAAAATGNGTTPAAAQVAARALCRPLEPRLYTLDLPIVVGFTAGHGLPAAGLVLHCRAQLEPQASKLKHLVVAEPISCKFSVRYEGDAAMLNGALPFSLNLGRDWMVAGTTSGIAKLQSAAAAAGGGSDSGELLLTSCLLVPVRAGRLQLPLLELGVDPRASIEVVHEEALAGDDDGGAGGQGVVVAPRAQTVAYCRPY